MRMTEERAARHADNIADDLIEDYERNVLGRNLTDEEWEPLHAQVVEELVGSIRVIDFPEVI